jgi:hypothetical protein
MAVDVDSPVTWLSLHGCWLKHLVNQPVTGRRGGEWELPTAVK